MIDCTTSDNTKDENESFSIKLENYDTNMQMNISLQEDRSVKEQDNNKMIDRSSTIDDFDRSKINCEQIDSSQTPSNNFGVPKFLVNKWLNIANSKSKFTSKNCQIDNPADVSIYSESSISPSHLDDINFINIVNPKNSRFSFKNARAANGFVLGKPGRTYSEGIIDSDSQINSVSSFHPEKGNSIVENNTSTVNNISDGDNTNKAKKKKNITNSEDRDNISPEK